MKKLTLSLSILILMAGLSTHPVFAAATVGKSAPAFEAMDANGKKQQLSDYTGKWLVLEWTNRDCPYVKKHYESGNMQSLQKKYTGKGVKWVSVLSSAKDKQGYFTQEEAKKFYQSPRSEASAVLLDPTGKMGNAYGAQTTPHIFVINPKGILVYAGAIDDQSSFDQKTIKTAKNYASQALDEGMADKPISVAATRSYGCGVKY